MEKETYELAIAQTWRCPESGRVYNIQLYKWMNDFYVSWQYDADTVHSSAVFFPHYNNAKLYFLVEVSNRHKEGFMAETCRCKDWMLTNHTAKPIPYIWKSKATLFYEDANG
jgi:hypothetical protein